MGFLQRGDNMERVVRIEINAKWDEEAKVWVASSDDIIGLATEADTIEELEAILAQVIPDLIEANGIKGVLQPRQNHLPELPFFLNTSKEMRLCG